MEDSRLILAGPWIEIWGAVVYLGILVSISIFKIRSLRQTQRAFK